MITQLFVYGTLAPGRQNQHILESVSGNWQPASVRGILYDKGWGANEGYPGIVLDAAGSKVDGFIFTSNELTKHLKRLDEFEGAGYQRVEATVELQDGTTVVAYIYELSAL